jgi:hypothetical protein
MGIAKHSFLKGGFEMGLLKYLIAINVVISLTFFLTKTTKAETSGTEPKSEILEKQAEIDTYLFEEHYEEIAQKGITVTHTVPLESSVEIGITPYTEENVNYLKGIFGSDAVTIVEGQQATTLGQSQDKTHEQADTIQEVGESAKSAPSNTPVYLATGGIVLVAGFIFGIRKKKMAN